MRIEIEGPDDFEAARKAIRFLDSAAVGLRHAPCRSGPIEFSWTEEIACLESLAGEMAGAIQDYKSKGRAADEGQPK